MVRYRASSVLFVVVFLCVLFVSVYADYTHPFEPYMPTPIQGSYAPASAFFVSYYVPSTGVHYCRYMYSTKLNNNLVYEDSVTSPRLRFEVGEYHSFEFSDSVWVYRGGYTYNGSIFSNVTIDWVLENADIYSNVDIVDEEGNVLFGSNARIVDGVLVPNDYTGGGEVPETPDYDEWYERVFGSITEWFSGVLEVLKAPFSAVAEGLNGVWNEIKNIKEYLKDLFIPSVNILPMIKDKFTDKFPIIEQAIDLFSGLFNVGDEEPVFKITYKGSSLKIVDFTVFSDYIPLIRNLTGAFILLSFLTREIRRLPRLIRGRD